MLQLLGFLRSVEGSHIGVELRNLKSGTAGPRPASEDQMEARPMEVLLQTAPLMLDTKEWREQKYGNTF